MLRDNLRPERRMRITVSVPDGEAIAAETLNPALGIEGGISILGTSGIVRPYSNAAYAATVALQFRSLAASGFTVGATATGSRTARRAAPRLPGACASRGGRDRGLHPCRGPRRRFRRTGKTDRRRMPGKLFKYACG